MKTRFEKNLRLVSDIMLYCHHHGATDITSRIKEESGRIEYEITATPVKLDETKLAEFKKRLTMERHRELENDYWELMGESQDFSEITLAGILCDEADVVYENDVLKIKLLRID